MKLLKISKIFESKDPIAYICRYAKRHVLSKDIENIFINLCERDENYYMLVKYTLRACKRIKRIENILYNKPHWAYLYAIDVKKRRWKKAEPYIMKDSQYAYLYAKNIIRGRWKKAEPYIMKATWCTYDYARYIIEIDGLKLSLSL